ncbi:hypothetical protein [Anabaena sp. PCC 7108]|uniref:hypothetical protein n=1 Tax=Anabaena sp. PCC 7108 TaxID=163908 RepID=UPI00034940F3|nr:hypothetical protein [Anabaena sp. PCC 7108]
MGEAKRRKKLDPNYGKSIPQNKSAGVDEEALSQPDYQALVDEYLKHGSAHVISKIQEWMQENDPPHLAYKILEDKKVVPNLDRLNKIAETVYVLASKQSKTLSSKAPKQGTFNLRIPAEPSDYGTYPPVHNNPELALEGMRLFNTGFFNKPITELINSNNDVVATLRKYVVIVYMGTNENYEIIDAACSLASLKPFEVIKYLGEQRHSLDAKFEKTFKPLASSIENFRISQKGADKYPCLTLLFFIENKINHKICEFRKHYTAQGGDQLVIPGFSSQPQGVYAGAPLDILGTPLNIPTIRGYEQFQNNDVNELNKRVETNVNSDKNHSDYENFYKENSDYNVMLVNHQAMTKRLTNPVYVYGSLVESIHILVCQHPMFSNRGFCHIKTQEKQITLWLDTPFQKKTIKNTDNFIEFPLREWYGNFTTEIIDGKVYSVNRKFSMKSIPNLGAEAQMQAMFTGEPVDRFVIEGLISTEVSVDLPPEEITIQAPSKLGETGMRS